MKRRIKRNLKALTIFLILAGLWLWRAGAYQNPATGILPPFKAYNESQILGIEVVSISKARFYVSNDMTQEEFKPLVECFMAALTLPSKDLWVNLKPEERHRIAPYRLGITELGKTMLEQDYLLKVAVATALHPDTTSGRDYWNKLEFAGSNPVFEMRQWIVPDEVEILDGDTSMLITKATLDVQREEVSASFVGFEEIVDEAIIPEVKRYIRTDKHFAPIRQAYRAVICAIWFKNKFLNSEYRSYINRDKTSGIEIEFEKEKVWDDYALMQKNKNWRKSYQNRYNNPKWRNYGGVEFKELSKQITVKEVALELTGKSFEVQFIPLMEETEHDKVYDDEVENLGGISLDVRIAVRKGTIKASKDEIEKWRLLKGLSYSVKGE